MAYKKHMPQKKSKSAIGLIIFLGIVGYYVGTYLSNRSQSLNARAGTGTAKIFLGPDNPTIPGTSQLILWTTVDQTTSFIHTNLKFDPQVIRLTQDITLNTPSLSRVIKKTSYTEANSTGIIDIVAALDPTTKSTNLTGTISFATLRFSPVNTSPNTTTITIDNSKSTVVGSDASVFNLQTSNTNILVNQPAPTASVTTTPTPASTDTTGPTITVLGPSNNQQYPTDRNLYIGLKANDSSGISKIEFYFDETLVKTCKSQTLCEFGYKVPFDQVPAGQHTVTLKAYDKSPAANFTQETRTVNR